MQNKKRLVSYISSDLLEWVKGESKRLGMSESTFVRHCILAYQKKGE